MFNNNSKIFLVNEDIEHEYAGEGVSRQLFGYDENIMLVKVHFSKGAIGALHSHPHVQSSYIASGRFEVAIGNEKTILKEGDGYFVPSEVVHGVVCLEDGILIDSFNPARTDFVTKL